MRIDLLAILIATACCCSPARETPAGQGAAASNPLTARDRRLLERCFEQGLYDPRTSTRVRCKVTSRSSWGSSFTVPVTAWLPPGSTSFVIADNLQELPVADRPELASFSKDLVGLTASSVVFDLPSFGRITPADWRIKPLILAAWAFRKGHRREAARLLGIARSNNPDYLKVRMIEALRHELAWQLFHQAVNAFIAGADDGALRWVSRLKQRYPDLLDKFGNGSELLADLKRRRAEGAFGTRSAPRPPGFGGWPAARRAAWLIRQLEHVTVMQISQPGGVQFTHSPIVEALIEIGDPAVPALLEAIESDDRLSRTIHFWRDFAVGRLVLGVREAALTAVMNILRVRVLVPRHTGDSLTARGSAGTGNVLRLLRRYWKQYGGDPFPQRMMKILRDPRASIDAHLDAAYNLATLDGKEGRIFGTTVFSSGTFERSEPRLRPHPGHTIFARPTVWEAILAAMGRDLARVDSEEQRQELHSRYLRLLVKLADRRALPELRRRLPLTRERWMAVDLRAAAFHLEHGDR